MLYKDGRIAGVQDTIDTDVIPNLKNSPWVVSALTANSSNYFLLSATVKAAGIVSTSLSASTTLTTMVDISGSGSLDLAAIQSTNATAATLKLVITVDGTEVFSYTSGNFASAYRTVLALGEYCALDGYVQGGQPVYFRSSLKIEIQQSANAAAVGYARYRLAAPYSA